MSIWKDKNRITKFEARRGLTWHNSHLAKMYGVVKIHIDTPTYNLSKMYANVLKKVSVENLFEFKDKINAVRLPESYLQVSLHVVSLFINISGTIVQCSRLKLV